MTSGRAPDAACDENDAGDWGVVDDITEDAALLECWHSLPFEIPYAEFEAQMRSLKLRHERHRLTQWTLWLLETGWAWSGYATSMKSAAQYRHVALGLLLWLVRA